MGRRCQNLQSRGPGVDPFRASGPKWGRQWPKNGFWPHPKNGGNMAGKLEKRAEIPFSNHFRAIFFPFPGLFSPFSGEAKIQFSAIFVPISGRKPEMDLYQVHGIPSQNTLFVPRRGAFLGRKPR